MISSILAGNVPLFHSATCYWQWTEKRFIYSMYGRKQIAISFSMDILYYTNGRVLSRSGTCPGIVYALHCVLGSDG